MTASDFRVIDHGSTFTFEPISDAASAFAAKLNYGDCYQVGCESGPGLIGALQANGFTIDQLVYKAIP